MDLSFTQQDIAFRDEVRQFLADEFDEDLKQKMAENRNNYMPKADHLRWQDALAKKGWLTPNWPVEHGGPGWTTTQKYIFDTEMANANAPGIMPFGVSMCAPVIMKFGTEEQKQRFLPDIRENKVWWCQGYSEPGSGSDLASLQMKAEDKGDHFLCNGSKIWTTLAQYADWIFCLVRTQSGGKPQEGISFLLIDMKSEGITVDPIPTLDLPIKGAQEVNQVFFNDVKVPKENLIGEMNKGWTCAKYLLEFERGNAYAGRLKRGLEKVRAIAAKEIDGQAPVIENAAFNAKLARLEIAVQALEMTELRILSKLTSGQNMGPESSLMKCRGTDLYQEVVALALEAVGTYSQPFIPLYPGQNEEPVGPDYASGVAPRYFNARKVSIYGGSNEIQRNIMAKLILGL
ncbi:MAG: pimeloyl-CoA dehydrogenase large subunit [Sneathiella sp.]|jgi:alkylation response protein AidB-like acyl-CoA dehydrogenase|uniref:acyl-CoA dehydrogenase family protein n=1 Tax=Sneathiella sp. TaxID=1964365 RepID=UPI000C619EDB|nr:acyl-CoA dehydrogenase family protein [Sneathiella sp.]MAL77535.1 pimeloyl-CoA dehydrogenase large subunit [Sneathiella sp.]MAL78837.1 pimeloyl-CoA dehydrogenase large subunit [Sneathiella sp.]